MEAILKKQTQILTNLEKISKKNEITGDNLNSNVIKLTFALREKIRGYIGKGIEPTTISTPEAIGKIDPDESKQIVDEVSSRRRYNELRNIKEDLKDLFSARGFLDKMGIARRGESGLISEFMDKRENRRKWIESRMRADPNMKNLKQFGGDQEKVKQYLKNKFNEKVSIEEQLSQNKEDITEQRNRGMTDEQIRRMGLFKTQNSLSARLKEIDPSLKEQPAKVVPFTKKEISGELSNKEITLERNKSLAEQNEILKKIEENTAVLKTEKTSATSIPMTPEGGAPGLFDNIPGSGILDGLKTAGRGLLRGASTVGRFALRNAGRLGAAGAVGMGLYEGYQGWSGASEKKETALADIDARVASGDLTPEQGENLKKKASETATIERGGSVGKGAGMAVGGAAGALKGAAAGAALGSVVPVIGTVIGGAIGATVGAIGGSYLGGVAGEWVGEKTSSFGASAAPVSTVNNVVGERPKVTPLTLPGTGDRIAQQSSEVDSARLTASKPNASTNAIVNAPTVNNTTRTNQVIRSSPRTQENSVTKYLEKRYA